MSDVSVVMSVYDEPEHVQKTIESVLNQEAIDFEFIIVSDGASDAVIQVVDSFIDDERIRFIKQQNQGLTVALINGCNCAKSPFIARIDAGDTMLESRLRTQCDKLVAEPSLGIVTSWVSIETVEGYFLYDLTFSNSQLNEKIRSLSADEFQSPFHASVMFRKTIYDQVGGYRDSFYFAQDCDLWSRMIECSELAVIESVLTCGIFAAQGISGKYANEQRQLLILILRAAKQRHNSLPEADVLSQAYQLRPTKIVKKRQDNKAPVDHFDGFYFVAKILTDNKSKHALSYWRKALICRPLSMKSWFFSLKIFLYLVINRKSS